MTDLIPAHGGYRQLKSFQSATLVYDLTVAFCDRFVRELRMRDQMVQAARSGRQNIAEGCQASGTSKKTELKLVNVARASQEELLLDFEDYLRQRGYRQWDKNSVETQAIRKLAHGSDRSNETYGTYMDQPEAAANALICLIHQTSYLLDRQLQSLEKEFAQNGGFTERLYTARKSNRGY